MHLFKADLTGIGAQVILRASIVRMEALGAFVLGQGRFPKQLGAGPSNEADKGGFARSGSNSGPGGSTNGGKQCWTGSGQECKRGVA